MSGVKEYIAIAIFAIVFLLIIDRKHFNNIPIWTSMLIGASLMVGLQVISIQSAFSSINLNVILFLFSMFSIVSALDKSGALGFIALKMLSRARGMDSFLFLFIVSMGVLSAFLVNDTIALLGVPLIIHISKKLIIGSSPKVLFISLAFAISIGSVMTPVGNPQNLLIATTSNISLPFITFMKWLVFPTVINLIVTYFILRRYFRKDLLLMQKYYNNHNNNGIRTPFEDIVSTTPSSAVDTKIIDNPHLAKVSVIVLVITIMGFIIAEVIHLFFNVATFSISIIAAFGATALYAVSKERRQILFDVDYSVLVFFAAMFVFTSGLWSSGMVSMIISHIPNPTPVDNDLLQTNAIISATSIAMSQILSNVPFVALYNPVMLENGFMSNDVSQWMMLAAACTIAGNLTIFGAASNIIIIEAAESRGIKQAFSFIEFLKIGSIVTASNIAVYYVFITLMGSGH
jgi:Na+/H+ antiporter NhaD/arsenite permease-like protein